MLRSEAKKADPAAAPSAKSASPVLDSRRISSPISSGQAPVMAVRTVDWTEASTCSGRLPAACLAISVTSATRKPSVSGGNRPPAAAAESSPGPNAETGRAALENGASLAEMALLTDMALRRPNMVAPRGEIDFG